jgi:hypothetical protein
MRGRATARNQAKIDKLFKLCLLRRLPGFAKPEIPGRTRGNLPRCWLEQRFPTQCRLLACSTRGVGRRYISPSRACPEGPIANPAPTPELADRCRGHCPARPRAIDGAGTQPRLRYWSLRNSAMRSRALLERSSEFALRLPALTPSAAP